MYENLQKEMKKHGLTQREVANAAEMPESSLSNCFHGQREFRFDEALEIRDNLFPGMTLEYLFAIRREEAVK